MAQAKEDIILQQYERLQEAMDQDTAKLRAEISGSPCAMTCYDCCRNTATLLIGEVEALDIKRGLAGLPTKVREYIRQKAERTASKLEQLGYQRQDPSQIST